MDSERTPISTVLKRSWALLLDAYPVLFRPLIALFFFNLLLVFTGPTQYHPEMSLTDITILSLTGVIRTAVTVLATAVLIIVYNRHYQRETITVSEALAQAYPKWIRLFLTQIIVIVGILGGSLLFIIPGIIIAVYWVFAILFVTLEDKSILDALRASMNLVTGNWWYTFLTYLTFGLLVLLFALFLYGISSILQNQNLENVLVLLSQVFIFFPVGVALNVVLYRVLK